MIQTYAHQKELHEARLNLKTIEGMFVNLITEGTNYSFFESEVIVAKAKEVFAIGEHAEGDILQPGQIMWPAVDENEQAAYGKTIRKTKIKPVFVDMIAPEDIEATLQGEKAMKVRKRVIVPRRGTIHDMGRSVTHKRQICYKMIVEGKSVEKTAQETNHSPEAITRYVKDYKRILACLHKGLTPKEPSFVAKVSESLVFEYENLIRENQVDIKEQMEKNGELLDDLPF